MPDFRDGRSETVFKHWHSLTAGKVPHYRDWDPVKIHKLMRDIFIVQRHMEGGYFYRFAGTGVGEFLGKEVTGLALDAMMKPDDWRDARQSLDELLGTPCGALLRNITQTNSGKLARVEFLILPLSVENDVCDRVISHMAVLETRGYASGAASFGARVFLEWIDLGFGVPGDNVLTDDDAVPVTEFTPPLG